MSLKPGRSWSRVFCEPQQKKQGFALSFGGWVREVDRLCPLSIFTYFYGFKGKTKQQFWWVVFLYFSFPIWRSAITNLADFGDYAKFFPSIIWRFNKKLCTFDLLEAHKF